MLLTGKTLDLRYSFDFSDKSILLSGVSGTGKSYFMDLCKDALGDDACLITYRMFEGDSVDSVLPDIRRRLSVKRKVALLDNAELYLYQDLLELALSNFDYVVVAIRDLSKAKLFRFVRYKVQYSESTLVFKRERK